MSVFKTLVYCTNAASLFTACNRVEKRTYKSHTEASKSQVEMK